MIIATNSATIGLERTYLALLPAHPEMLLHLILRFHEETSQYPTHIQIATRHYPRIEHEQISFLAPFDRLEWILGLDQLEQVGEQQKTAQTTQVEPSDDLKWYQVRCQVRVPVHLQMD